MKRSNKILVTGASGQLGRKLIRKLESEGYSIKAHFRSEKKAERWNIYNAEPVFGDLLDDNWQNKAVEGCDAVIHCAAWVSLRQVSAKLMYAINVDGTGKIAEACHNSKTVKRLIHISSVAAVGGTRGKEPLDETAEFNLLKHNIPYFTTKYLAEKEAFKFNDGHLDVISVNPSIMISPPDREITEGDLAKIPKRIPAYFNFAINLVQTDDVIDGIIAALEKGQPGQRYILGGENIDQNKVFEITSKYFGVKKPKLRLPYSLILLVGAIMSGFTSFKRIFKKDIPAPKLSLNMARLIKYRFIYSSEKAKQELGYRPVAIESTIESILSGLKKQLQPKQSVLHKII